MTDALLSLVEARAIDIDAPPRVVWEVLLGSVPGPRGSAWLRVGAVVLGAEPRAANGLASHTIGAERPGFAVCEVVAPVTYALAGRHRFAHYQLVFGIMQRDAGRCRLTAETFARFTGHGSRIYRTLVVDTNTHALVTWTMLRMLRRRAERHARAEGSPFP